MWRDATERSFDSGTGGMRSFWKDVPLRANGVQFDGQTPMFVRVLPPGGDVRAGGQLS